MRENQFYERLNQIRSKYGYFDQKTATKQPNLSFNKPQAMLPSYRESLKQNDPSPKRHPPQIDMSKYNKPQIQKPFALGVSHNRTFERERAQHNTNITNQNRAQYKQHSTQRSFNENNCFQKTKPSYKNSINENLSPSPIKKLGIDYAYQSSPVKKDRIGQRNEDYQVLKPFNRNNYEPTNANQAEGTIKKGHILTRQREYQASQKNKQNNYMNSKSFREQMSLENQNFYARNSYGLKQQEKEQQKFETPEHINKDSVFNQKLTYNVKNIDKIQDKINSILHRQK